MSIRDRDDQSLDTVDEQNLRDKSYNNTDANLLIRVWRRRHIENYLLFPAAIARASGKTLDEVNALLAIHALTIPDNFTDRIVPAALLDARGKEITQKDDNSIKQRFGTTPIQIAKAMEANEVCQDIRELIGQINAMCQV